MTPMSLDRLVLGRLGAMSHPRRASWVGALLGASIAAGTLVGLAVRPAAGALVAAVPAGDRASVAVASRLPSGFAAAATRAVPRHSPPIEVAIPVIGVRSRLVGLRLNDAGALQAPTDFSVAGWYRDGSAPGDPGVPAIIAGHVDSRSGPGVFFRLAEVRPGDVIFVRRADGTNVRFVVYQATSYPKDSFPTTTVYRAHQTPELRLVTCTGVFDRRTEHYESNRVVFARILLASPAPAKRR